MPRTLVQDLKLLGKSPEIAQVRRAIRNSARHDVDVLLVGESGTGKQFVAEHIHMLSDRKSEPFVTIPCDAIGKTLTVDDVFAPPQKGGAGGLVYEAGAGTLYLERAELLDRDLQDQFFSFFHHRTPNTAVPFKARLITAMEPEIGSRLERKEYRQDLFQVFAQFRITIPALRERKQDIPFLFTHILEELSEEYNKPMPTVPYEIFEAILEYSWPANLFEMRNVVRNLIIMSPEGQLSASYLPFYNKPNPLEFLANMDLPSAVAEVERFLIKKALAKYEGNQSKAARMLQISEAALRYKMKKYNFPSSR
jgi:DNA-binding NtrC family response regulator